MFRHCDPSRPIQDISDRFPPFAPALSLGGGIVPPPGPANAANVDARRGARFAGDAVFAAAASAAPRSISITARCTTGESLARIASSLRTPPVVAGPSRGASSPPLAYASSSSTSAARPRGPFVFFPPVVAASVLTSDQRRFLPAPLNRGSAESQPRITGLKAGGPGTAALGVRAAASSSSVTNAAAPRARPPPVGGPILAGVVAPGEVFPVPAFDLLGVVVPALAASTRSLASLVKSCSASSAPPTCS